MALPSTLVWEARATGNNLNAGFFDAARRGSGTDYSQQDAPLVAFTDLVIDGTNAAKVSSSQTGFTSAHVGNGIRIASGAGFTAGVYVISSVSGGVATLDRDCGTTGSTAGAGRLGGAVATFSRLASDMVASNLAFIKAGSYSEAATVTFSQSAGAPVYNLPPTRLVGYSATRGDYDTHGLSRPVITVGGSGDGITIAGTGWEILNLEVMGSGLDRTISCAGSGFVLVHNCKVSGFTRYGLNLDSNSHADFCEVTGSTGTAQSAISLNNANATQCYVHDCTLSQYGISVGGVTTLSRSVIANLGGSASGIQLATFGRKAVLFNTLYNIANHGIFINGDLDSAGLLVRGNIIAKCGAYGIATFAAYTQGFPAMSQLSGNAFGGGSAANVLGNHGYLDDAGAVNPVDSYLTYRYSGDVTATDDPFVNAASADFRLNSGAGAVLKGTGPCNSCPTVEGLGALGFGVFQTDEKVQNHAFYYF